MCDGAPIKQPVPSVGRTPCVSRRVSVALLQIVRLVVQRAFNQFGVEVVDVVELVVTQNYFFIKYDFEGGVVCEKDLGFPCNQ